MKAKTIRIGVALALLMLAGRSDMAAAQGVQSPAAAPALGPQWRVLIGDWAGEGGGQPGSATGRTSFRYEAGERAIIRRNHAAVAASAGRPASVHEDLLTIYAGPKNGEARAVYVDNEDHVIQYTAVWSPDGKTLTFVSDAVAGAPRFRMVYRIQSPDRHVLDFEIAPPGAPDVFKLYVTGALTRTASSR